MSNNKIEIPIEDDENVNIQEQEEKIIEEEAGKKESETAQQYIDMLKRLQAEFDNYRKRVQKEKSELSYYAKSQVIYNLLPVIDDFQHMFRADSVEDNTGLLLIFQKMMNILESEGLEEIKSVGEEFDPQIHEAVVIEQTNEDKDDLISDEIQKGYFFKEQLLRPARVKVLKRISE